MNLRSKLENLTAPVESDFSTQDEYYTAVLEYSEQKEALMNEFLTAVEKSKTKCDLVDRIGEAKLFKRKFEA